LVDEPQRFEEAVLFADHGYFGGGDFEADARIFRRRWLFPWIRR
jgi:hypothetical protein